MLLWLPVMHNLCTWRELETIYTIEDVMKFHDLISLKSAIAALPPLKGD